MCFIGGGWEAASGNPIPGRNFVNIFQEKWWFSFQEICLFEKNGFEYLNSRIIFQNIGLFFKSANAAEAAVDPAPAQAARPPLSPVHPSNP